MSSLPFVEWGFSFMYVPVRLDAECPSPMQLFSNSINASVSTKVCLICCRSKDLESVCDAAVLQGVGLQAVVTEYLITYADLIFNDKMPSFNGASLQGKGTILKLCNIIKWGEGRAECYFHYVGQQI